MKRITEMTAGVLFAVAVCAGTVHAQDWYWIGGTSPNWADLSNWNDAADGSGSAPSAAGDLQNKDLMLLTTGTNLPSNQNIGGLAVSELMFDASLTSFTVSGEPIQLNHRFNTVGNPGSGQTVTFENDLVKNASSSWIVRNKVTFSMEGEVSEIGGSRSHGGNHNGRVEFHGPVTISGGFRNNQSRAAFYGMETTGTAPAAFDADYFRSGYGSWQFSSPDGDFYRYDLAADAGMTTTENPGVFVDDDVVLTLNAPVTENNPGKSVTKWNDGVLVLNGANTFTGELSPARGLVILNGSLEPLDMIDPDHGSLDLAGNDVICDELRFSNGSGFMSTGGIRNTDRTTTSTVDGDITNMGSNPSVRQFGGPGNIRLTGDITDSSSGPHLAKTGAGTLILAGSSSHGGGVSIFGGELALDYGADNSSKIGDTGLVALNGSLRVTGNGATDTIETVGDLDIGSLANTSTNTTRITDNGAGRNKETLGFDE